MPGNFRETIGASIAEAMSQDNRIVLLGEGVADAKGVFGTCLEARRRFPNRVIETPLSETMLTGACVGMAMEGLIPLYVHARFDFTLFCFEHLINTAAKLAALGRKCPIVFRVIVGRGWGQGPTHSQSFHGMLAQVPGLDVFIPYSPSLYVQALAHALHSGRPTVIVESRRLYEQGLETWMWWETGCDIVLRPVGDGVLDAVEAQAQLMKLGLKANVEPLLQCNQLIGSMDSTTPSVIIDMGHGGFGLMLGFGYERATVLCQRFEPTPMRSDLEATAYPTAADIVGTALQLLGKQERSTEHRLFQNDGKPQWLREEAF